MTTKHMSITILDQGESARITIHMQGPHIREYVSSGEWTKEQSELMERLKSFNAIAGQFKGDQVRVELLVPKAALFQGNSLSDVAEQMLAVALQKGWKADHCAVGVGDDRSVKFTLSN